MLHEGNYTLFDIPRLHAGEQRRLLEGKIAMEELRSPDDGDSGPTADPRYQAERDQRRAETLADIEAEAGEAAVVF